MTDAASPKTSLSHPLRIDHVDAPGGGMIGMTFCPGRKGGGASSGTWVRDLDLDLDRIRDWGAVAVVTMMEEQELANCEIAGLSAAVRDRGMTWHHLPIVDVDVPREPLERAWSTSGPQLRADLAAGRKILLHCLGGLGRTGTIAARLLVELGVPAGRRLRLCGKRGPVQWLGKICQRTSGILRDRPSLYGFDHHPVISVAKQFAFGAWVLGIWSG
jgi:ADP-ribosyl-[dinitrogen reductase] hydrolase